jgi:hypothetical protein
MHKSACTIPTHTNLPYAAIIPTVEISIMRFMSILVALKLVHPSIHSKRHRLSCVSIDARLNATYSFPLAHETSFNTISPQSRIKPDCPRSMVDSVLKERILITKHRGSGGEYVAFWEDIWFCLLLAMVLFFKLGRMHPGRISKVLGAILPCMLYWQDRGLRF